MSWQCVEESHLIYTCLWVCCEKTYVCKSTAPQNYLHSVRFPIRLQKILNISSFAPLSDVPTGALEKWKKIKGFILLYK